MPGEAHPQLIEGLRDRRAYPHPTRAIAVIETHISWVVLTGDFAYKIKKPVNFGFLDFSDIAKRRFYCQEEIRLNQRYAPDIYLSVEPIGGSADQPIVGASDPLLDYAVKMRQFDQRGIFRSLLAWRELSSTQIDRTAELIAELHRDAEHVAPAKGLGTAAAVRKAMEETLRVLHERASDSAERSRLTELTAWAESQFSRLAPLLEERRRQGHVRECHGDLHLGNLVWLDGRPVPFDCIEFDPALRWIDVVSEIAFFGMDLDVQGAGTLAARFLNRYEALTSDYGGLRMWDYFRFYRALVRAKVSRLGIADSADRTRIAALTADYLRYLAYAEQLTVRRQPRLFITHGLSGSGKSFVAEEVATQYPAIWLRSDIERKRLCPGPDTGRRYSETVTAETYARLRDLAAILIEAGLSVVVDATFLRRNQRNGQRALAERLRAPFTIIDVETPLDVIEQRIAERQSGNLDPSEATIAVARSQHRFAEHLTDDERPHVVRVDGQHPGLPDLIQRLRALPGQASLGAEV